MLTTLLLLATLTPAPPADAPLPVEATFDGRGRVHTVAAALSGERLTVHGTFTVPAPFAPARRAVHVEVLGADGTILATREVTALRGHIRAVRRHPVSARFVAEVEGVAGAASVRIRAAR